MQKGVLLPFCPVLYSFENWRCQIFFSSLWQTYLNYVSVSFEQVAQNLKLSYLWLGSELNDKPAPQFLTEFFRTNSV